jgi:hypothetical protein
MMQLERFKSLKSLVMRANSDLDSVSKCLLLSNQSFSSNRIYSEVMLKASLSSSSIPVINAAPINKILVACPNKYDFWMLQRLLGTLPSYKIDHTDSYNETCRFIGMSYYKIIFVDTRMKAGQY